MTFKRIHDFSVRPRTWFHGTSSKRFYEIMSGKGYPLTSKSELPLEISFFSPAFYIAMSYAIRRAILDESDPVVLEVYKPPRSVLREDGNESPALFSLDNVKVSTVRYC